MISPPIVSTILLFLKKYVTHCDLGVTFSVIYNGDHIMKTSQPRPTKCLVISKNL